MIHFDAHPDLACPNASIPAAACFQPRHEFVPLSTTAAAAAPTTTPPSSCTDIVSSDSSCVQQKEEDKGVATTTTKNLYEMLDSTTSGIAEWILPLVLAANLSEIRWIRPLAQNVPGQFPLGERVYRVGAWSSSNSKKSQNSDEDVSYCQESTPTPTTIVSFLDLPPTAVVKCDWDCLYYRDEELDSSYAPTKDLLLAQPVKLLVEEIDATATPPRPCTLHSCTPLQTERTTRRPPFPWTLDICLDYFVCLNPFIVDIQALDPDFSRALTSLVCQAKCYQENNRETLLEFRTCFRNLLQSLLVDFSNAAATPAILKPCFSKTTKMMRMVAPLLTFYMDSSRAENLASGLMDALWQGGNDVETQTKLVSLAIEALPHLTMPHSEVTIISPSKKRRRLDVEDDQSSSTSSPSPAAAAAHGERSQPLQQQERMLIAHMVHYIQEYQQQSSLTTEALTNSNGGDDDGDDESDNDEPFLVTIARSGQDGFTPPDIVESLQDGVLEAVHDLYCDCGGKPKTPAATRPSPSSNGMHGPPVALPSKTNAPTSDPSPSCGNSKTNCRVKIVFDYGCWEGSTLDLSQ
jgi:UPF0489 domain